MMVIVDKDNGRTVALPLGSSVKIVLPENATTGYRWTVDRYDDALIEEVSTESHYASNALGSGGNVSFVFRVRKAGSGKIALKEWRSWEGDASVANRFCVTLHIAPGQ